MPERPKINSQFQDLHTGNPSRDWVTLQKIEGDICLFYHQQANYSYVMSDLYYSDVYALPYWDFLNLEGLPDDRLEFIQSGCLMIILAMCWELLDGSGTFLRSYLSEVVERVRACHPITDRVARLRQHVEDILAQLHEARPAIPGFEGISQWAHQEFVLGYFRRWSEKFDTNPYYRGG